MKKTAIFCVEEVESSKQGNTRSSEQQQARKHKWVLRVFSHLTASCRQVNLIPWHWQSGQSRPSGWVVLAGSSVPHDQLQTQPHSHWSVCLCVCGQCVCGQFGFHVTFNTSALSNQHLTTTLTRNYPNWLMCATVTQSLSPNYLHWVQQTWQSPFTLTRWLTQIYSLDTSSWRDTTISTPFTSPTWLSLRWPMWHRSQNSKVRFLEVLSHDSQYTRNTSKHNRWPRQVDLASCFIITGSAVALHCVKAHRQSQWRSPNFNPL